MITTTPAKNHAAGDAAVGAVGVVDCGYYVGGGRGPGGSDEGGCPGPKG
jgi:hypothetical protein